MRNKKGWKYCVCALFHVPFPVARSHHSSSCCSAINHTATYCCRWEPCKLETCTGQQRTHMGATDCCWLTWQAQCCSTPRSSCTNPHQVAFCAVKARRGCAVLCCAVLCCAVLCCAVLCCAVLCCAVLCCAVLCCAVLCCAVLCCAVLCCAVPCCAVPSYTPAAAVCCCPAIGAAFFGVVECWLRT